MVDVRFSRFGRVQTVHGLHWVERHRHVAQRTSVAADRDPPARQPGGILLYVLDDATSARVLGQRATQAALLRAGAVVVCPGYLGGTETVVRGEQLHRERLHGHRLLRRPWRGVLVTTLHILRQRHHGSAHPSRKKVALDLLPHRRYRSVHPSHKRVLGVVCMVGE